MAEAEQRLQSSRSGKAAVPADWSPQSPQRRPSNRQAKNSFEDAASRSWMRDSKQIFPDNASLARAGRQFTVGNIGNNGRIYLRYDASFPFSEQCGPQPLLFVGLNYRRVTMLTIRITVDQLYVRVLNARDLHRLHSPSRLEKSPTQSRISKIDRKRLQLVVILLARALPPRLRL